MANAQQKLEAAANMHRSGMLAEAEKIYTDVLASDKRNVLAMSLLGTLFIQTGRAEAAIPHLLKASAMDPRNPEYLNNLGAAYLNAGNINEAIKRYQQLARLRPDYAEGLNNLGAALLQAGRRDEGIPHLEAALKLNPDYLQARLNIAKAYMNNGKGDEALLHFKEAHRLNPQNADTLFHLGTLLRTANRYDEAIEIYENAVRVLPNDHRVKNNLGNLYRESGRPQDALPYYDEAIRIDPNYVEAHINRGVALQDTGDLDGAEVCYETALRLVPNSVDTYINLGSLNLRKNNLDIARGHYQKALDLQPDSVHAQWNMAMVELALGDYLNGWAHYEVGFGAHDKRGIPPFGDAKKWWGEPLAGKRVMMWGEQGLGDQLQFVRYATHLKDMGAEVSALVAKPLLSILASHPAISRITDQANEQDFDYHIAMMSLPNRMATTIDSIPGETPYLFAAPEYKAKWAGKIPNNGRLRVGLVWAGNARENLPHANLIDRRRSMNLSLLQPLLEVDGADFINLQMGPPVKQLDGLNLRGKIFDPMGDVKDFMDTAAIIDQLDLVISVDTSVVHLTGALGKPVWVLSRHDPCWRWLNNRADSPWYPSARVFGQPGPGDWESVVQNVKNALIQRVKTT